MNVRRAVRQDFDSILALLVLLASAVVFYYSYHHLVTSKSVDQMLATDVPFGETNYQLEYNGGCAGSIFIAVTSGELFRVRLNLSLDVLFASMSSEAEIKVDSYFNPLGQLIGSRFDLHFLGEKLVVRTDDVNPISLKVYGQLIGKSIEKKFSLPGPVTMVVREERGVFDLSYPFLNNIPLPINVSPSKFALDDIGLKIRKMADNNELCKGLTSKPVELDRLLYPSQMKNPENAEQRGEA